MYKQFAGLSGFPGLGVTQGLSQGLSSSLPFGQNLNPTGAFQPKVLTELLLFQSFAHETDFLLIIITACYVSSSVSAFV